MVKDGNMRVIATISPRVQVNLAYLEEQTGLKKSSIISLALNNYADLLRKEKKD